MSRSSKSTLDAIQRPTGELSIESLEADIDNIDT